MKLKNTFIEGKMNKDVDERLLPKGQYPHAENIRVINTDSSDIGAIENVKGNEIIINNYLPDDAVCIGSEADDSNGKLYFFITSSTKDGVYEMDKGNLTIVPLLESSSGGILNFNYDYLITGISKVYNEDVNKDMLYWTDDLNPPRKINIERAKSYELDGFEEEDISVIKKPPLIKPSLLLSNTPSNEESFLKDKFVTFAYRYIYLDEESSVFSEYSDVAFIPQQVNINYVSGDEEGMSNAFNKVDVSFNTGDHRVKRVDVIYKESGKNTKYLIDSYDKKEQGWEDDQNVIISISNKKSRIVLSDEDTLRPYDNVPVKAKTMTYIGNRIAYGNYTEGYDLIDSESNTIKIDYDVNLQSEDLDQNQEILASITSSGDITDPDVNIGTVQNNLVSFDLSQTDLSQGNILDFEFSLRSVGTSNLYTVINTSQQNRDNYDEWYRSPIGGNFGYADPLPNEGEDPDGTGVIPVYNPPALQYELKSDSIGSYTLRLSYLLHRTFDNVEDLATDTSFIFFIESTVSGYMNTGFTAPERFTIPPLSEDIDGTKEVVSNFDLMFDTGSPSLITIKAPVYRYDFDNGSSTDYQNLYWYFESQGIYINKVNSSTSSINKTVKSLRSYELGVVYKDKWGRKSSVLTSENNTVYIDSSTMSQRNFFTVDIKNKPPQWATSYSIYIKQPTLNYKTILSNTLYRQGDHVWCRIEGDNINKVSVGDKLVLRQDLATEDRDLQKTLDELIIYDVLDVVQHPENFITTTDDIEPAGRYMKLQYGLGGDLNKSGSNVKVLTGSGRRRYINESTYCTTSFSENLPSGTTVRFYTKLHGSGSGSTNLEFSETYVVQGEFTSLKEWHDIFLVNQQSFVDMANTHAKDGLSGLYVNDNNEYCYKARDGYEHTGRSTRKMNVELNVRIELATPLIFETFEDADPSSNIFYETIDSYPIQNDYHTGNINNQSLSEPARIRMNFYNSYVQREGLETYSYFNRFNSNRLIIDQSPSSELLEGYSQIRRFADVTYSEPYNEGSGFNGLSTFDLTKANFKNDIEKKYGSIQHLYARDTDLIVFQENKVSRVLYGKDILLNADGTSNISSTDLVLGHQIPFTGEYGISKNPESFDFYGQYLYFTDIKRGVVMRLDNSGLHEISKNGMSTFFKNEFKKNVTIRAGYDSFHNQYVLHVSNQEDSFTLTYDEKVKGWTSFHSYSPDNIISLNNDFFTFDKGNLYLHDSDNVDRNNYYGNTVKSKVSVMMNDSPSEIKNVQTLSLEGSAPWESLLTSYISSTEDFKRSSIRTIEFVQKEGIWYAHTRRDESDTQEDSKSLYGLGVIHNVSSDIISMIGSHNSLTVGDILMNGEDMSTIGTIDDIEYDSQNHITSIFVSDTSGVNVGNFILGKKDSRIEGGNLRGYTIRVDLENESSDKVELFAVNAEVKKSYT